MSPLSIPTHRLDRLAISLSGLCLVHCIATTVLLAVLSAAGGILGSHWIHEVGLTLAMILGAFALGRGIQEHGFMMPSAVGGLGLGVMAGALSMPHDGSEAGATIIGVLILALGHDLNRRGTTNPFGSRRTTA
ncbi:MerC domain-containing protein [Sphingomonas arenae]|uniref:MerC domain-containing protein n=1 Tax=Sphingomonas arenae TaxID=2812555 RepID=UPI001F259090|nr:MerC domain-containing protein [Sphingomonas arenae]